MKTPARCVVYINPTAEHLIWDVTAAYTQPDGGYTPKK